MTVDGSEDVIYEIVAVLAALDDVAPTELEYRLDEYVHPQALIDLLAQECAPWDLTFQVPDHEVTVTHDGEIFVDGAHRGSVHTPSRGAATTGRRGLESRHRRSVLEDLPCMLYRWRNQHAWPADYVSDACQDLTGYDAEAFVSRGVSYELDVIHPADRQDVRDAVQRSLGDEEPFSHTYRIRTADDEEKPVWDTGRGVFVDGDPVAFVGCVTVAPGHGSAEVEDLSEP